jgi:hypothetical protein
VELTVRQATESHLPSLRTPVTAIVRERIWAWYALLGGAISLRAFVTVRKAAC